MLYLPWMPAVLARGALDYLLPRLSMEGKEPKSLVLPLSSTIHPISQRTFSPTRKTFDTFVTAPTIVRYLEIIFFVCHNQFFPLFLLIFFAFPFPFSLPFSIYLPHTTLFPPLRVTSLLPPTPSLTAPHDLLSLPPPLTLPLLLLSLPLSGVGQS